MLPSTQTHFSTRLRAKAPENKNCIIPITSCCFSLHWFLSTCLAAEIDSPSQVHRQDEDFHFNVCGNAVRKPSECVRLLGESNVRKAIGYQTADGVCYYMGLLSTGKWSLLDRRRPSQGVKLTYTGGSQCDGATQRSTQFQFDCNRRAGLGRPVTVFGDCEFIITWETSLACPNREVRASPNKQSSS